MPASKLVRPNYRNKPQKSGTSNTLSSGVGKRMEPPRTASSLQSELSQADSTAPLKIELDELRCELILQLLEAILIKTVEDINSGLGGEVASSVDLNASKPLAIEDIEENKAQVERRNAIACSVLTGVSCVALLESEQRVVLWSALIKTLSYRLPMITPFQLHRLFTDESYNKSRSGLERNQSITMMKILMQVPVHHKRVLAALAVVIDVSCFSSFAVARNAVDMICPATFPSIYMRKKDKSGDDSLADNIMQGRSLFALLIDAVGVCLCPLQDEFIGRNRRLAEILGASLLPLAINQPYRLMSLP